MLYAFVDTNIFIRFVSQGKPRCEREHFNALKDLVREEVVVLLVPEVVLLELDKHSRRLAKEFESNCDTILDLLRNPKKPWWSEIDSLTEGLVDYIQTYKRQKQEDCRIVMPDVLRFLRSGPVRVIELTPAILVAAKRRIIAERMPVAKSDQDALIIESLAAYFEAELDDANPELLFCSENFKDFAAEGIRADKDRHLVLHPLLSESLPSTTYFIDLSTMLEFARGFENMPHPTTDEIETAMVLRDVNDDPDSDEFRFLNDFVEELTNERLAEQFATTIEPTLPQYVILKREEIIDEIVSLLDKMRACASWDERSEYKLPTWLEHIRENMIPYASLPALIRIRRSLRRYLKVHEDIDRERQQPGSLRQEIGDE